MKRALFFLLILCSSLHGKTIAEKKASVTQQGTDLKPELKQILTDANSSFTQKHQQLHALYDQVMEMYEQKAPEGSYRHLLEQIKSLKAGMSLQQEAWRKGTREGVKTEGYALWHQPDTSIGQLVIDYGSQDFVYLFTPEIGQIKISVASNLPIPEASWDEMLELILKENGVGMKQLNPYLRQLYSLKENRSGVDLITNKRADLSLLPPTSKVCFVLTPEAADTKRAWELLNRFSNPHSITLQIMGGNVYIVGHPEEVKELLKLYDFVASNRGDKEYKAVSLRRVDPEEMARMLGAIFDHFEPKEPSADGKPVPVLAEGGSGLRVITLQNIGQALFLVGTQEEIRKAEEIIREVETQVGDAKEKVIHWYTAKHSNAEDLANVLAKIYVLTVQQAASGNAAATEKDVNEVIAEFTFEQSLPPPPHLPMTAGCGATDNDCCYYLNDCNFEAAKAREERNRDPNRNRTNFIVDPKTGSIVMVVEAALLPQIKDLIKRLDVPKKMVQLEVLLFEKRLRRQNDFGLNLLKVGTAASQTHASSALWNTPPEAHGVFQYLLSRTKTAAGFPAFDLIYKFMMTQDDLTINATPSVVTMNQTPARIAIEDEISINTGVYQINTEGGVTLKDSYARGCYGIKIDITPTIHYGDDDCEDPEIPYVTLETDVTFETIQKGHNPNRPDVTRRIINNHVRIPDGQTVVLGGLRRKITHDRKEMIPFVGELPGFGKLFSITEMEDSSTEMYIFITPTIITSPAEDLERIRTRELCRRPGDIPSFLCHLQEARRRERELAMALTMEMLFGREPERCEYKLCEYDGRTCWK